MAQHGAPQEQQQQQQQVPSPAAPDPVPQVGHVAIRLPPYWTQDPYVWFLQVELHFQLANITAQLTRFRHVASALPPAVASEVADILTHPPPNNPYDHLKATLLQRTTTSERCRLQQLLSAEQLGDRTPSQLLRKMQALLGDRLPTFDQALLKELFLQRLPSNAQMILAAASNISLTDLAALADRIMEVATPTVAATFSYPVPPSVPSPPPPPVGAYATIVPSTSTAAISELRAEVNRLSALVEQQSSRSCSRCGRSSPRRYRRRSPSRSPNRTANQPGPCWYHERFGAAARHCTTPCTWQPGNPSGDR